MGQTKFGKAIKDKISIFLLMKERQQTELSQKLIGGLLSLRKREPEKS